MDRYVVLAADASWAKLQVGRGLRDGVRRTDILHRPKRRSYGALHAARSRVPHVFALDFGAAILIAA